MEALADIASGTRILKELILRPQTVISCHRQQRALTCGLQKEGGRGGRIRICHPQDCSCLAEAR